MKKTLILITLVLFTVSCKNSEEKKDIKIINNININQLDKKETPSDNKIYKGDFIYMADAAVLKGNNFIYGVTLDEKMHELADRVRSVKQTDFDMVPVAVKGVISPKPEGEEGWPEIITITEIVMVGTKPSEIDIKLEDKK